MRFLYVLVLLFMYDNAFADTEISGDITTNTTWPKIGSPYHVTAMIQVLDGATLTIDPGVTIRFDENTDLTISGELISVGTSAEPIVFTASGVSYWGGILFLDSSVDATVLGYDYVSGSIIKHCVIENAGAVVNEYYPRHAIETYESSPYISNNTLTDNKRASIYLQQSSSVVIGNTITNTTGGGITIIYGMPVIVNNEISSNSQWGIELYFKAMPVIEYNNIYDNRYGFVFQIPETAPPIYHNNIDNNTYNINMLSTSETPEIDFRHNWWGTTNQTVIEEKIYDYYDDHELGTIIFEPYSTAPWDISQAPPVITSVSIPDALENAGYSFQIVVENIQGIEAVQFELVSAPSWMSIGASGILTGSPTNDDIGTDYAVSIKVTNSFGLSNTLNTSINVLDVNDPPEIITEFLPYAVKGEAYEYQIEYIDPDENDTCVCELIVGPHWLGITNNGLLYGTPGLSDVGTTIQIKIKVSDMNGGENELATILNVLDLNEPPEIITESLPEAVQGEAYSFQIEVTDPDENDTCVYEILVGPDWLSITSAGLLNGTPEQGDIGTDIPVTIQVSDMNDGEDTLVTTMIVVAANNTPVIMETELENGIVGVAYHDTVFVADEDPDDECYFSILDGPEWIHIDNDGILSGMPESTDTGIDIPISIRVSDTGGLADTLATTISVNLYDPNSVAETPPHAFSLSAPYPNPFNPTTTINYSLPEAGDVVLTIFNSLGQTACILVSGYQETGRYSVVWDAHLYSDGVYFCNLKANGYTETRKMLLIK